MIKNGKISISGTPLLLAPMEDISDRPFRKICKRFGADLVYTEFISSEGLIRDAAKSTEKLLVYDDERPVGIQIFGHNTASMVKAAQQAAKASPDLIDLNYGCPVKKVVKKGAGAALLRTPEHMISMTKAIVEAVDIPVTVKTRLGWDYEIIIIDQIAERLQETGIAALTIHGRTRSQLYKGEADWSFIKKIKNNPNINIPIIGNGDINSAIKAKYYLDHYRPDALMIGRAAIGNPWIFAQIAHYLNTGETLPPPALEERISVSLEHLQEEAAIKGEHQAVIEMRKAYSGYFKGVSNFKHYKIKLMQAESVHEVQNIFEELKNSHL
jgi:nifR3 family TIM-barrel protein